VSTISIASGPILYVKSAFVGRAVLTFEVQGYGLGLKHRLSPPYLFAPKTD
jgi:hypothetical protein